MIYPIAQLFLEYCDIYPTNPTLRHLLARLGFSVQEIDSWPVWRIRLGATKYGKANLFRGACLHVHNT